MIVLILLFSNLIFSFLLFLFYFCQRFLFVLFKPMCFSLLVIIYLKMFKILTTLHLSYWYFLFRVFFIFSCICYSLFFFIQFRVKLFTNQFISPDSYITSILFTVQLYYFLLQDFFIRRVFQFLIPHTVRNSRFSLPQYKLFFFFFIITFFIFSFNISLSLFLLPWLTIYAPLSTYLYNSSLLQIFNFFYSFSRLVFYLICN